MTLFVSESIGEVRDEEDIERFSSLKDAVRDSFRDYNGHIFFMAAGIVVRLVSGLLESKLTDPAVVVVDDRGLNAISLLSGHVGEANKLTLEVADVLGANPVITTATDVNRLPSIDLFALENDLVIENPETIKHVNMAILKGEEIPVYDPYGFLENGFDYDGICNTEPEALKKGAVYIDFRVLDLPDEVLVLRPKILSAGIGCNRGTDVQEIWDLLLRVFKENHISVNSLHSIASIDLKKDEAGILKTGERLCLPVKFYNKNDLNNTEGIETPSPMAEKYTGAKSVCEAAAIRAAGNGKLIVSKQKTKNVTLAVAISSI